MGNKSLTLHISFCILGLLTLLRNNVSINHKENFILSDTTNLIVRVRTYPPGIDMYSRATNNYGTRVYAYKYINGRPIKYQVKKFNLVYSDQDNVHVMESFDNTNTLTAEMKKYINKLDSTNYNNLFLENISIADSTGKQFLLKGPQRALQSIDEE